MEESWTCRRFLLCFLSRRLLGGLHLLLTLTLQVVRFLGFRSQRLPLFGGLLLLRAVRFCLYTLAFGWCSGLFGCWGSFLCRWSGWLGFGCGGFGFGFRGGSVDVDWFLGISRHLLRVIWTYRFKVLRSRWFCLRSGSGCQLCSVIPAESDQLGTTKSASIPWDRKKLTSVSCPPRHCRLPG